MNLAVQLARAILGALIFAALGSAAAVIVCGLLQVSAHWMHVALSAGMTSGLFIGGRYGWRGAL